jgi:hypothetical protein
MKIKFETKKNPKEAYVPPITIFMENKSDDTVEFLVTTVDIKQTELIGRNEVQKSDKPITDGKFILSKSNLKKFIRALQLMDKS